MREKIFQTQAVAEAIGTIVDEVIDFDNFWNHKFVKIYDLYTAGTSPFTSIECV